MAIFGIIEAPTTSKVWVGSFFDDITSKEEARGALRIVMSKNHQTEIDRKFLEFP